MYYLLTISYDGKNYYGWEKQPNVPTIRSMIENATKKVFGKTYKAISSGRTDRYVHAIALPVLLIGDNTLPEKEVIEKLNYFLPEDIKINSIKLAEKNFLVRYKTKSKKYRYLTNLKSQGDSNYYNNYSHDFDLNKFIENSNKLIGEKDFSSFTGSKNYQTYVREIFSIESKIKDDILIFEIEGNGFLKYMVRNIVGSLLANNSGIISDEEFLDYLTNPEKGKSHYKAVGSGLYLVEVKY